MEVKKIKEILSVKKDLEQALPVGYDFWEAVIYNKDEEGAFLNSEEYNSKHIFPESFYKNFSKVFNYKK